MQLFYTPDINGDTYTLTQEESKHCVRVLRKEIGQEIRLIDGRGNLYRAVVVDDNPKRCTVQVTETVTEYGKRAYNLHIAIAPTKNIDRFEWFLEKATEIGVDVITPLECDHSERRVVKIDRALKVVTSAVKQSLKAYHPQVDEMMRFRKFVERDFGATKKFIGHCETDAPKVLLRDAFAAGEACVILIGPEGDFSSEEIALAHRCGFVDISLGESRLRTETAGVVACATIQIGNELRR